MKKNVKNIVKIILLIANVIQINAGQAKSKNVDTKSMPQEKVVKAKPTQIKTTTATKKVVVNTAQKTTTKTIEYNPDDHNRVPADAYLVDEIKAVVFAQEGQQLITAADTQRPSLEGKVRNLDEQILEKLMYLDGMKFKMQADDETIDKHLALIQRENNMTLDDLKKVFQSSGYSYEEGRQQFGVISVINQLLDFRIRSRLIVPEKEVVAYYNAHPEKEEAALYIQRALIPYSGAQSKQVQQEEIEAFINDNAGSVKIEWQDPFWVNEADLAENKKFITLMDQGGISMPQRTADGFELFKLVQKKAERVRSLEDRYREISDVLRKPRYEKLFNEYKKQLFDSASVLYF